MSGFAADDARLAAMHGYVTVRGLGPGLCPCGLNYWGFGHVCQTEAQRQARITALATAFRRVRREVWSEREARLMAKWESYG